MPIQCRAEDCLHNQGGRCRSSIVQILGFDVPGRAGNTCATHTADPGTYLLTAMERPSVPSKGSWDSEIAEEISVFHAMGGPAILCDVSNCIFNSKKNCTAGNVAIGRGLRKNLPGFPCRTFRAQ